MNEFKKITRNPTMEEIVDYLDYLVYELNQELSSIDEDNLCDDLWRKIGGNK